MNKVCLREKAVQARDLFLAANGAEREANSLLDDAKRWRQQARALSMQIYRAGYSLSSLLKRKK